MNIFDKIVIIGAARYYMGRNTLAAKEFCDRVSAHMDDIDHSTRIQLYDDVSRYLRYCDDLQSDSIYVKNWRNLLESLEDCEDVNRHKKAIEWGLLE